MEATLPLPDEYKTCDRKWYTSKPFWRQLLVSSGVWAMYFMTGMMVGAPTVFIPQIQREVNSTFQVTEETKSWLYSVYGFGAVPWVFIVPTISRFIGRRLPFILATLNVMLVFVMLYISQTTTQIMIGLIMEGYFQACNLSICIIILSEYTSPVYRGIFLTLKTASFCWGFWVSNFIGTFFHWKYIAVFGMFICCHTFTSFFWPESPHWLASRGRFEECKASFRWLNGHNEVSEKELKNLIESQTKYLMKKDQTRKCCVLSEYNSVKFYKPLFITTLLIIMYFFTGKFVSSIYILEIIKKINGNEKMAYTTMLILDGFTVFGVYCGSVLTRVVSRRKMYLVTAVMGIVLLLVTSLYLYLVKLSIIEEIKILSVVLLTCLGVVMNAGPMALTTTFLGELIPLKFKASLALITACEYMMLSTIVLKTAPKLFKTFGIHGTFFIYGIVTIVGTYLLYLYLPETKDKTLQEIEENFGNKEPKTSAQSREENESFVPQ